jgi:pyridoxine 5-phosphate synthase
MAGLIVKIDHAATLRQAGNGSLSPDPVAAALMAELAGADGIAVHLRQDRSRIQERDVRLLRSMLQHGLVLEMGATSEIVGIALDVQPDLINIVPEMDPGLICPDGFDLTVHAKDIAETVAALQNNGVAVSIFIDPEPEQIKIAHQIRANGVTLNTHAFCRAATQTARTQAVSRVVDAAKLAHKLRLRVMAGNGLNYTTIKAFKGLKEIEAFTVGHSIMARAMLTGLQSAVKEMLALIQAL